MTINERIVLLISELRMNNNSFSNKISVSPTVIHNIIKGRNAPSYEVIQKIALTFDNINIAWLILGNGEMFLSEEKKESLNENLTVPEKKEQSCPNCDVLRNYIKLLEEKLAGYEGRATA